MTDNNNIENMSIEYVAFLLCRMRDTSKISSNDRGFFMNEEIFDDENTTKCTDGKGRAQSVVNTHRYPKRKRKLTEDRQRVIIKVGGSIVGKNIAPIRRKTHGRVNKYTDDIVRPLKLWWTMNSDHPYPTKQDQIKLGEMTGLAPHQVYSWFNAMRFKVRHGKIKV